MSDVTFRTKVLRPGQRPGDFEIYRAALEWDLADPILIEKREDLKSERRWGGRLEPYHHQVQNLITFCRRLPVTLLADDVGLGKTISAGLIVSELIARNRLSRILIVCPKLLGPQWKEELDSKFDVHAEVATGRELLEAEPEDPGAIITTYNSARMYLDQLPQDRFQMLILDEAHKLRNLYGTEKAPAVAVRFREALEQRRFRFVLMLTATPIHNRLWDLYSLVELLTIARGHQSPFGKPGAFASRFIADSRSEARQLNPQTKDEFRSIVYGYMSRVRRGDADLYFPDRQVQMHKVDPLPQELELLEVMGKWITRMNKLAQISLLQALTSSPQALLAQLRNMVRNGTAPEPLLQAVEQIVARMTTSAKLLGLAALVQQLQQEDPERWRLVVFTGRRETQTVIEAYLESCGLRVGTINGDSASRNQDTLKAFRKNPPDIRVIVSTEAGSEGVNLQVANVLVNYDLPWNPMIVEQRIGRVQRLASEHAYVAIFNVMLRGTFEEYIVGRLMEKLQMASHAIGDIEALLEASGMDDDEGGESFEEKLRQLVVAALTGKDVEAATRQADQSIEQAKTVLESESAAINNMLGSMDGAAYVGPRMPTLPTVVRSMEPEAFAVAALRSLGQNVIERGDALYLEERGHERRFVCNEADAGPGILLYAPGTPAFERLVDQMIATGIHSVTDMDSDAAATSRHVAEDWVRTFDGKPKSLSVGAVKRTFRGDVTLRVRATVAHDSYERLVNVPCDPGASGRPAPSAVAPFGPVLERAEELGVDPQWLQTEARRDEGIQEFCRFYLERRAEEVQSAGSDERRRKRLEDEFTPRLDMTLVAANGAVSREVEAVVRYGVGSDDTFENRLTIVPAEKRIVEIPDMAVCTVSGRRVPVACLQRCEISGAGVLRHLLVTSDISGRRARPEYMVRCEATGKTVLRDEVGVSDVTGRTVALAHLQPSAVSGKRAEPEHFGTCEVTGVRALATELARSDISGRSYRSDQRATSAVSGKTGHPSEFAKCAITGNLLAPKEGEACEMTGARVLPGLLENCSQTGKRVLPNQLDSCAATGAKALRHLLVTSSLSGARMLEGSAVRSLSGTYCLPAEARACSWSGEVCHPADLRACGLTGLPVASRYTDSGPVAVLQPLAELVERVRRDADGQEYWDKINSAAVAAAGRGRCGVQSATFSPDRKRLAVCFELWTLLGLRAQTGGLVFDIPSQSVIGRVVLGKQRARARELQPVG